MQQINRMKNKKIISKGDCDALHALRLLGNDAAHELFVPSEKELNDTMDTVDAVLAPIYVVPHRTKLQKNIRAKRRSD